MIVRRHGTSPVSRCPVPTFCKLTEDRPSEVWTPSDFGVAPALAGPAFAELAFAAFSVAAVHAVAATAESAAGAFVQFAACAPRPPFVGRDAGDRGLAVAGVFAVPGPASVEAFPAAADISGPSSYFR